MSMIFMGPRSYRLRFECFYNFMGPGLSLIYVCACVYRHIHIYIDELRKTRIQTTSFPQEILTISRAWQIAITGKRRITNGRLPLKGLTLQHLWILNSTPAQFQKSVYESTRNITDNPFSIDRIDCQMLMKGSLFRWTEIACINHLIYNNILAPLFG